MVLTTLMLALGLPATSEPQAGPQKGWAGELDGYTYHRGAKPQRWIIEWQGFTKHRGQGEPPKGTPLDRPKPVQEVLAQARYVDDLAAYIKQLKLQEQGGAVEGVYVDDLPAFFERLKKQKP
jgi:hypothetical protein